MDIGLLVLRLVVGLTLAAHGTQKLFGWFGGYGLSGTGGFMESLGFVPGRRAAFFAGLAETLGGLLLALGLVTPLAAAIIIGVMLVAVATVHISKGFFATAGGYEYNLVLATAALTVAFTGAGAWSLDAVLGLSRHGLAWGVGALLLGLVGAGLQLAGRQRRQAPQQAANTAASN
jgi:putative oxidoreductase